MTDYETIYWSEEAIRSYIEWLEDIAIDSVR